MYTVVWACTYRQQQACIGVDVLEIIVDNLVEKNFNQYFFYMMPILDIFFFKKILEYRFLDNVKQ